MRLSGIGVDIARISRFREIEKRYGMRLLQRVLSKEEIVEYKTRPKAVRATFLASRWAAKEALYKCLTHPFRFNQVEVIRSEDGVPAFKNHSNVLLSISHDGDYAIAMVAKNRDWYAFFFLPEIQQVFIFLVFGLTW